MSVVTLRGASTSKRFSTILDVNGSCRNGMKVECLDYREVPGQNSLYLRYLYDDERIRHWYPARVPDLGVLKDRAERIISSGREYPRAALVEPLEQFNREIGADAAAMVSIRRLSENDTVAVVTGQQVGILGGPALAVYKAMTAVGLCRLLGQAGVKSVPVFWLASDDSDFEEVSTTVLLDQQGQLLDLRFQPGVESHVMAGTVPLAGIDALLDTVEQAGVKGMFKTTILEDLRRCYGAQRTLRHGFGAWMASLFREQGLVLYDALTPGLKNHLRTAYSKAVEYRDELLESLKVRSRELREAGLSPQVQVDDDETLLFLLDSNRRYKVEYQSDRYLARNDSQMSWDSQTFLSLVSQQPERLGPTALLRPIMQDSLFPTVAYVGGPAEIAYFAQVNAIAPFWNVETAVVPRAGVTIVDAKAQRLLARHGLTVRDIVGSSEQGTRDRLARDSAAGSLIGRFDALESVVEASVASIRAEISHIDPTLPDMLSNSEAKMLYQVSKGRDRFIRNYARHSSDLERHVGFLHNSLYPRGVLQERLLNFSHFLTLYGPGFVGQVLDRLEPLCREHQILYVSPS